MKAKRKWVGTLILTIILIAIDQYTKILAVRYLGGGRRIPLINGVLELTYVENRGAAFGIFQNGTLILSVTSAIAVAVFIYLYFRIPDESRFRPLRVILVFLTAGAAGNLIDRVMLHYVRDFIYFSLIDFPVFNVADMYVTVSVFFLLILLLFVYKDEDLDRLKIFG